MTGVSLYSVLFGLGLVVGVGASFSGLGGGFLMVPLLLFMGYTAQKAVGTSFLGILIISVSALIAHNKLANIDWRAGVLLGLGGAIGAQVGSRLLINVPTEVFQKIFAVILLCLAVYVFFRKAG
ncbi:MAG: sulfite exporter TauE/SafE family protein [Desulfovibrio sp.]|nr:MAG: sulfite exporter TauE/SafE family protein [Desulfovibrio sp.]